MATASRLSRVSVIFRRLDNVRRLPQYSSPQLLKYKPTYNLNEPLSRFLSTSCLKREQQQAKREETQCEFYPLCLNNNGLKLAFNFINFAR